MYADHELVAHINAGNLNAFRYLVTAHEKLVTHMIRRVIQDEDDVKDVAQEVFIKVYRHIKTFKQESKLSTWIAQIAYTTSLDHLKRDQKRKHVLDGEADTERVTQADLNTPGRILENKELREKILNLIAELPENYRLAVQLFHIDDYSYQEISDITGLSEGTIKSHLFRARKVLKDKLIKILA